MSSLKHGNDLGIVGNVCKKRALNTSAPIFAPIRIATEQAGEAADANTLMSQLAKAMPNSSCATAGQTQKGRSVVYWMRMSDLRIRDNRALSRASARAQEDDIPVIALFVLSPQDYIAHDRSPRRIDFLLRNLACLKESFSTLNIPFQVSVHTPRKTLPNFVASFCERYDCKSLFANVEYEVDELRRDIEVCKLAASQGVQFNLTHDRCVIEPGVIVTKQSKPYTIYSPYQKNWLSTLNSNISTYLDECAMPKANDKRARFSKPLADLFDTRVPKTCSGFDLEEHEADRMREMWPAGEEAAAQALDKFVSAKAQPTATGISNGSKNQGSQITRYAKERDRTDSETTSRLSPYLASGVISARACVRATLKNGHVESDKASGVGRWIQEIAWRDFYTNVLAGFPRVSMGRPYLEKFSKVIWEQSSSSSSTHLANSVLSIEEEDCEALEKWKTGMTGVPIVDATMRCLNETGWVHNRARMITAMYLTKDLMIDWRIGERYFMQRLIDGDLASNNGGWQWCASTGVDPCPYFRIFNPYTQSAKADPNGKFIRQWVTELKTVTGPEIHNPSVALAKRLRYPLPIISHQEARERALRRYKNPGSV